MVPDALLVLLLAAPDHGTREAAERALWARMPTPVVWRGLGHADAEVRQRCDRLVRRHVERACDRLRPFPFLDALWFDCRTRSYGTWEESWLRRRFADYLPPDGPTVAPQPWPRYRDGTERLAREALAAGAPEGWVRVGLEVMRGRDRVYLAGVAP